VVWLAKGRSEIAIVFTSVNRPFNHALQGELIAKLGARLEATG
jgi:hypothetical protein